MALETNSARFATDVIEASQQQPVLVDFWAPWCGPCRMVGPVLEKLAAEAGGRWLLVKVNTDENQDLAARYQISGIPAMKLFRDGSVVAELTGALPEREMRRWLDEQIPSRQRTTLDAARAAKAEGRTEEARQLAEAVLAETASDAEATLLLAELALPGDPAGARRLLDGLAPRDVDVDERVDAIRDLAAFASRNGDSAAEGPLRRYLEGARALREGRFADTAEALLEVIRADRTLDDDGARRALVALFAWLGDEHDVTRLYRPKLASALF